MHCWISDTSLKISGCRRRKQSNECEQSGGMVVGRTEVNTESGGVVSANHRLATAHVSNQGQTAVNSMDR